MPRRGPQAELHLYSGPAVYGAVGDAKAAPMRAVLARAEALADKGVRLFPPLPRVGLIAALRASRVMLYRGDRNETFCMAVAEAQALGVPAVVQPLGSLPERVQDGITGFIAMGDDESFAQRAIALLTDDALWRRQHEAALGTATPARAPTTWRSVSRRCCRDAHPASDGGRAAWRRRGVLRAARDRA